MNKEKLSQLDTLMKEQLETGLINGGALCIFKDGKRIYRKNFGMADVARDIPIRDNTIYRMFSMTKPVTAAALMILYDRGLIDLNDSVSWYLDGFKDQTVATDSGVVPVNREATLKDLLNMTSGLMYPDRGINKSGDMLADVFDKHYSLINTRGKGYSTVEFCNLIGKVPLCAHPGEIWNYGTSADIIGGVIEVVSGKKYGDFLKEEIFEPLGMTDTDFYVPEEKRDRFAEVYIRNSDGKLEVCEWQHIGLAYKYTKRPEFESGGAGLVSTVDDYSKFALMLLNGGIYNGRRILSSRAVRLISENHLTEGQKKTFNWDSCYGYGYGGLMRVIEDRNTATVGEIGEYGWDGWTGNYFCNDPVNNISFLYFTQVGGTNGPRPIRKLKQAIYAALDD